MMRRYFSPTFERFIASLIPRKCLCCNKSTDDFICEKCMKRLAVEATQLCPKCGNTLVLCGCMPESLRESGCEGLTSVFTYSKTADSAAKSLILRLKTCDVAGGFRFITSIIAPALGDRRDWLVTYVPRRSRSVMEYGFDQAKRLAESLADELGCDFAVTLKRRGSTVQKELNYEERHAYASRSYKIYGKKFMGRRVILVDDIVTSGATLSECTKLLLQSGAESVYVVTAARSGHEIKEEKSTQEEVGFSANESGEDNG